MMDNIFIRTDPAGNIKPDKEKSIERIDGVVGAIMALDRALRNNGNPGDSVECIEAIRASMTVEAFAGYLSGNCMKYLWRYKHKGGVQDQCTGEFYLKALIRLEKERE